MMRLLAISAVFASALTNIAFAFSNQPGTCTLKGMKVTGGVTNPHGFAPSAAMTYTLAATQMDANTYSITLSGTGTYTGLLLFAEDSNNASTRFGAFSNFNSGLSPLTTCGGVNPAGNTLGHNSATPKTLPLTVTWSDAGYAGAYSAVFGGIVMSDVAATWFSVQPLIITRAAGASPTASMSSAMAATTSSMGAAATTNSMGSAMSSSMNSMNSMSSMSMASSSMSSSMMSGSSISMGGASMTTMTMSNGTVVTMTANSAGRASGSIVLLIFSFLLACLV